MSWCYGKHIYQAGGSLGKTNETYDGECLVTHTSLMIVLTDTYPLITEVLSDENQITKIS